MANSLAGLIPDLYEARDVVSRELTGFIPSVTHNASAERAAVGQTITIHQTPSMVMTDVTPSMNQTDPADQTIGKTDIVITKSKSVEFAWTGEEQRGLNHGAGYRNIQVDQISQAMRTITNAIEVDLALTVADASRAYGTAGTSPFATNLKDTAQMGKILSDNGASPDRHLVLGTTAGAEMRTLSNLTRVNEANDDFLLRRGMLTDIHGFQIRESAGVQNINVGSITANVTVTGVNAIGATAIGVTTDATGAVSLSKGDIITFAGDTNKYVVAVAVTIGSSTTGTITIAKPGLRIATVGTDAISAISDFEANFAFARNAIQLVTRAPEMPEEGDSAWDVETIIDPVSGLAFEVTMYKGKRKVKYEISAAWGVKNIKPEHSAILLG